MLSKKYYVEIAKILRKVDLQNKNPALISRITVELADFFERDNPAFNRQRFYDVIDPPFSTSKQ